MVVGCEEGDGWGEEGGEEGGEGGVEQRVEGVDYQERPCG